MEAHSTVVVPQNIEEKMQLALDAAREKLQADAAEHAQTRQHHVDARVTAAVSELKAENEARRADATVPLGIEERMQLALDAARAKMQADANAHTEHVDARVVSDEHGGDNAVGA